jgi:signal transduction histidine kinase
MMAATSGNKLRTWVAGLVQPGRIEVLLAASLAGLAIFINFGTNQPLSALVLDLAACIAAGASARWPRVAGLLLAVVLGLYLVVPLEWKTMGEYSPLIVILGTGMRGQLRTRSVLTVVYAALLGGLTYLAGRASSTVVLGWIMWGALIGVLWLIGNAFHTVSEAHRQSRAAELVLQRQAVARELHDTVARSFTRVTMVAERARLRGLVTDEDLATISAEAAKGVDELRWVMTLLREPEVPVSALVAQRASLAKTLDNAKKGLERDGLVVSTVVEGDLDRLAAAQSAVLAAVAEEAVANISKHAAAGSTCLIVVRINLAQAELAFSNVPATFDEEEVRSQHFGVWGMAQRLAEFGGTLVAGLDGEHWVTRATLPLSTEAEDKGGDQAE